MKHKNNKGFSLIELLVAIAILGIVTVPLLHAFVTSAKTAARSRQMGNATIAGKNLAEYVESNTVAEMLQFPVRSFSPAGGPEVTLLGYGQNGVLPEYTDGDKTQYICLRDVPGGGAEFEARVTLDAAWEEYETRNAKAMSEYGNMDAVFAQSRTDANDPDTVARAEFLAYANREHTSWPGTYNVTRVIDLTVETDDAEPDKLNASLEFTYTYTYVYITNEIQPDGTIIPVTHSDGRYEVVRSYTLFPHGYTFKVGTAEKYPNIYLMYYPMYESTPDNIFIHNEENLPFTLFLVKQKDPNLSDVDIQGKENTYVSLVGQYQDYVQQETTGADRYAAAAEIYSNAKDALIENGSAPSSVSYKLYFGDHLMRDTNFVGTEGSGSLVKQSPRDRLYKVTVEIFMPGDDYSTAAPLYRFTTTKLQ